MLNRYFIIHVFLLFSLLASCQPVDNYTSADSTDSWQDSITIATKQRIKHYLNEDIPLKKLLDSLHIRQSTIQVHISKLDYELRMMSGQKALKAYPIVLGHNPTDDKRYEGDCCTPEGQFKVRAKYPHSSWSYFIWINYPTEDSWRKHRLSKKHGEIDKNASIGGEIGIHGVPEGSDELIEQKVNWTLGCISLSTNAIKEIYPYIQVGTPVRIFKTWPEGK